MGCIVVTDPNENTIERLGGTDFAECPQCMTRFRVRLPTHCITVFYQGEVSSREEDDVDLFCSSACASQYVNKRNANAPPDCHWAYFGPFDGRGL